VSADGKRVALYRAEALRFSTNPNQERPDRPLPPDVTVWDVASGQELFHQELQQQPLSIRAGGFPQLSPDGATIALLERGRGADAKPSTLTFIDVATRLPGTKIEVAGNEASFCFSPDGRRIAVGLAGPPFSFAQFSFPSNFRQVDVFDAKTGKRISAIDGDNFAATNFGAAMLTLEGSAWSLDGSRLALPERPGAKIHLFDATTGKRVQTLDASSRGGSLAFGPNRGLAFSPDGKRIACVIQSRNGRVSTVNVVDTESGRVMLSLQPPADLLLGGGALRFSSDGHRLTHFGSAIELTGRPPEVVAKSQIQLTTWDATPRPESK